MARFVPFAAVAGANCVNLPFMRWNEIRDGIALFDKDGKRVGGRSKTSDFVVFLLRKGKIKLCLIQESSKAAKNAIAQVVLSRIGMAVPGLKIDSNSLLLSLFS